MELNLVCFGQQVKLLHFAFRLFHATIVVTYSGCISPSNAQEGVGMVSSRTPGLADNYVGRFSLISWKLYWIL